MKGRDGFALVVLVLFIAGCSGSSRYVLDYNVLSYVKEQHTVGDVESSKIDEEAHLYILPYSELLFGNENPDLILRRGVEYQYPVPSVPEGGNLELLLEAGIKLKNLSTEHQIDEVEIGLYIAEAESQDIFSEGEKALEIDFAGAEPNEEVSLEVQKKIVEGSPGWDILVTGDIRCGIEIVFRPVSGGTLHLKYAIEKLRIAISLIPFAYIP
ncbi:MAG TPA: hypothetical protein ENN41_02225 [Sediminispirochaeta sp.]|nr:hypothetical protein [Sediminispirochaeta sp.]